MKEISTITRTHLALVLSVTAGVQKMDKALEGVDAILELITDQLSKGNRIELRNFGVFEVVERKAKIGRNVYENTAVKIPRRKVVKFWAGKDLGNRVS